MSECETGEYLLLDSNAIVVCMSVCFFYLFGTLAIW